MTKEEMIQELEEEWDVFLEGTGLKYKTEEGFQKELDDNPDLKKVVEANIMARDILKQRTCEDAVNRELKIGDEIYIRANVNEIRKDYIICENAGGYFGTVREEIKSSVTPIHRDRTV